MVQIIDINKDNIDDYGLFCRKSYMKSEGNQNKVKWLKERFKEGLKYKLLIVKERGKDTSRGFIEYIPGEYNWRGIDAKDWMVVHCLWVTGQAKKKGSGTLLVQEAIKDAKDQGLHGVVAMTADKQGWMPNPKIFEKNGFEMVAEMDPYFKLYALTFSDDAPTPKFFPISEKNAEKYKNGVTILFSDQCPHVSDLIKEVEEHCEGKEINFEAIKMTECSEAQQGGIHPYGLYSCLCNGKVISYKPGMRKQTIELIDNC